MYIFCKILNVSLDQFIVLLLNKKYKYILVVGRYRR